ncbi:MAG TPA: helix-turn-helix domain-containing protein, partial [Chthonomonadaceae bacterium]|nr:helix-turn-helix domain-containing protein [Chthonomonadaceae bacterium]
MKRITKKDLALSLHAAGRTVEEIAQALQCSPSYVANVLIASGKPSDYSDLYTSSAAQNAYARMFAGVLRF